MKAKGRTSYGTKVWEFPEASSIKIREIVNRARGEDFGVSYQVIIPTRVTGRERLRRQFAERLRAPVTMAMQIDRWKRYPGMIFRFS
jgi:hypothetical protein